MLSTSDFDYHLPEDLIAQHPAEKRDGSRMLVLKRDGSGCEIRDFPAILDYLRPGDALIFNDTKVLRGRMFARKNGLADAARFEMLLVAALDASGMVWKVLLKPGKRATPGTPAYFTGPDGEVNTLGDGFEVLGRCEDEAFEVRFFGSDLETLQHRYGHIPLPPYIRRGDENADAERYQTVFAREPGAVAAPTAGLHFTETILDQLRAKGVATAALTLHVGPGTFKPVSVEDVREHRMHFEEFTLPEATAELVNRTRRAGGRIWAVGTTTVRVLESCAAPDGTVAAGRGRTDIFLYPPYRPRAVDGLLTNFHLPKSTLMMLVSTFAPRETVLTAYRQAIAARMRFYSYGDCMLLTP